MMSGIFKRAWNLIEQMDQVSEPNPTECPPTEATAANGDDVWEVPPEIGELTVSKLLVHPIKVSDHCYS